MKMKCAICHKSDNRNQMHQDSYYSDVWMHLKCLNSDKAKQWRAIKRTEVAEYNRYMELISDAVPTQCDSCGHVNTICVKGNGSVLEVNCDQCHKVYTHALNPAHDGDRELHNALQEMLNLFARDSSKPAIIKVQNTMELLASKYDEFGKCKCGGVYSILAKPRCCKCGEIVVDSYFHYVAPRGEDL